MPKAVHATSAVTATVFAKRFQPDPPRAIISEEPACDSEPRCHETQTELASANQVAILGQLSASIAEINQPISAVVMFVLGCISWKSRPPMAGDVRA